MLKARSRPTYSGLANLTEVLRLAQILLFRVYTIQWWLLVVWNIHCLQTFSKINPFFGNRSIRSRLVYSTTIIVTHHALVLVKEILFDPFLLYFNNTGNTII